MMNRKKSKWLGVGKYGLFIGMLWLCAAFTKPYRAKVAAKIVEKVPELKLVTESKPARKTVFNDFVWNQTEKSLTDSVDFENNIMEAETKYVFYKDSVLHWTITPLVTFTDFVLIQQEFEKHGLKIIVDEWKADPWGRFIRAISVSYSRGDKELGKVVIKTNNEKVNPIASFGGQIPLNSKNKKYSFNSEISSLLKPFAEADEKSANLFIDLFKTDYLTKILEEKSRRCTDAGADTNSSEHFITDDQKLKVTKGQWVFESPYRKIVMNNPYENAKLFLDGNEVNFDDVIFEEVKRVKFYSICPIEGGKVVLLFTKRQ